MGNIERVMRFVRAQAIKLAVSAVVMLALILSLANRVSQAVSTRPHLSNATVLTATIRPHRLVTINSEFPGQVLAVHVSSGNEVKAGDLLVTLENAEFDLEYERAKVHHETTTRRRENHSMGYTTDQTSAERVLTAATDRLAAFSLDAAASNYEKAQARRDEIQKLVQQGLATQRELDDAVRTAGYALRDLQAEREHLSRLKEEVELARARVIDAERTVRPSDVAENLNLEMEVREAETALKIASQRRDSKRISSTAAGTVLKVMVNVGDQIPSGFPLAQIGQLDSLDFDVPVDGLLARKLKVGKAVSVRVPTEPPAQIWAPISAILLVPSQDQSAYTVRITIKNPAPSAILAGLSGQVEFPQ